MSVNAVSNSPAVVETERQVLVLKKQQDVVKETSQALVDLLKTAPAAAPGRIDTYA